MRKLLRGHNDVAAVTATAPAEGDFSVGFSFFTHKQSGYFRLSAQEGAWPRSFLREKPGCRGNARQKEILLASGHELEIRNLLTEPWTEESLRLFFGDRPVAEWFHPTNPRVKAGEVVPSAVGREAALAMMVDEPLLIVRPLMQVGGERLAGFDVAQVHNWIGLRHDSVGERDPKNCPFDTGGTDRTSPIRQQP
jgi:nitrogenase-associated protein